MKKTLLLFLVPVLFFAACKKDSKEQEGYNFTTAYKNTLNVQVEIQFGRQYQINGKDTTAFSTPGIIVKAGEAYESTYFVCQKNCPMVYVDPMVPLDFVKMIIGTKEKIDTNCAYYFRQNETARQACDVDAANFFNNNQWKDTKDKAGNIIRHEYVIDAVDLSEAK